MAFNDNTPPNRPIYPRGFITPEGKAVSIRAMRNALAMVHQGPEQNYEGWNWYPTDGHSILREVRRGIHDRINRRVSR